MKNEFKNKKILVTGGTGSIGSVIVKQLLKLKPKQVRIFSRDETKQFELERELNVGTKVSFLIGDIRDKERLSMAMENIDIVFHAAALKHVDSCEKNPFEAVKTNVHGTQNVVDCALENKVNKVIGISTDKATDPTNVMGCTKLLQEKIMLTTHFYKGRKKTKFCCVRFGNVLGSRGSVVPLFIKQAKIGGPLTVSKSSMTRFFMTTEEAVNLLFKASEITKGGEIFILKMPALRIGDLAKAVIAISKESDNGVNKKITTKIIGNKNGERDHEKLLTADEARGALETKNMFIIMPPSIRGDLYKEGRVYSTAKKAKRKDYDSKTVKHLKIGQIKTMIKEFLA